MHDQITFPEFTTLLKSGLARPLPGQSAQFQMAPLARRQPKAASVESKACREAAVLALFYPCSKGRPKLLLTVRPEALNNHAGQVAFPGGRREPGEELLVTALRETEEEVFIARDKVSILGELSSLFVPPSNFCVYPYVGVMNEKPDMSVQSDEVASMFGVRAFGLVSPESREVDQMTLSGKARPIPYFSFAGKRVWGATAMMMAELAAVIKPDLLELQPLV